LAPRRTVTQTNAEFTISKTNQNHYERRVMKEKLVKFDEVAKSLAQSVTRRQALRRFGVGLAGAVLTFLGLANEAEANPHCKKSFHRCIDDFDCCSGVCVCGLLRCHCL